MNSKDLSHVLITCLTITSAAVLLYALNGSLLWDVLWADPGNCYLFVQQRLQNSSFYDAYWSVSPPLIALYWAMASSSRVWTPVAGSS